jgi:uncharacterized protein YbjT (DUF2867 family)
MTRRILVSGGTGLLGRPVVQRLAADGFTVRVMTRHVGRARGVLADDVEAFEGNPCETSVVRQALAGCDALYLNLPSGSELPIAAAAAQAARAVGIARLACISGATVCVENRWFPPTEQKWLAEEAIRASGVAYTIFRPSWFMESLPLFVVKGRAVVFGRQPHPFRWVAAGDYARMVSSSLRADACAGKTLHVLGPEPIRMHDALRRYCAAFHPEIKSVSTMPIWLAKALAVLTRKPTLSFIAQLMAYFDRVGDMGDPTEANALLGAPTTTLQEWIAARQAQ